MPAPSSPDALSAARSASVAASSALSALYHSLAARARELAELHAARDPAERLSVNGEGDASRTAGNGGGRVGEGGEGCWEEKARRAGRELDACMAKLGAARGEDRRALESLRNLLHGTAGPSPSPAHPPPAPPAADDSDDDPLTSLSPPVVPPRPSLPPLVPSDEAKHLCRAAGRPFPGYARKADELVTEWLLRCEDGREKLPCIKGDGEFRAVGKVHWLPARTAFARRGPDALRLANERRGKNRVLFYGYLGLALGRFFSSVARKKDRCAVHAKSGTECYGVAGYKRGPGAPEGDNGDGEASSEEDGDEGMEDEDGLMEELGEAEVADAEPNGDPGT
ncbi:hypothetical protein DFJ74DRAFT_771849 [Hyaloraphidium curvatum]|nr:hypothetical protein DFJ74DRAFT_771849 [Hyaloraphidium curvatum]